MHGSFSRADTWNFMAMRGPDFKSQFVDPAPPSNADLGRTIVQLMHLDVSDKGKLVGRVLSEALPGGVVPKISGRVVQARIATVRRTDRIMPSAAGAQEILPSWPELARFTVK